MRDASTNYSVPEFDLSNDQPDRNNPLGSGKKSASVPEARPAHEPNQKIQHTPNEQTVALHEATSTPRLKIVEENGQNYAFVDAKNAELFRKAVGADDNIFLDGTFNQLAEACTRDGVVDERKLNFMISIIRGIKPRDQIEAMIAAEMAMAHDTMMSFMGRLRTAGSVEEVDSLGNVANKLMRTFTMQMEALYRCRSGGEKKVTVQNVSVSDGGQAIVGTVTQNAPASNKTSAASSQSVVTDARTMPMPIIEQSEKPILASIKRRQRN